MPAIQPARLKHQTVELAAVFEKPEQFLRVCQGLLELYADRTHRSGLSGEPSPLVESYRVPQPVLKEILYELKSQIQTKPQAALIICQSLWDRPILENKLLAAGILGQITPAPPQRILQLIQDWLELQPDDLLINALLDQGLYRLRNEQMEALLAQIEVWLAQENHFIRRCGLWAACYTALDPKFHDLPALFHLISPFIRSVPPDLRADLLNILRDLAHHAPQETAFLLKQNIGGPQSSETAWLTRQLLPDFPAPIQDKLRTALRPS
jgi:hypothetical protein